jgi:type II secretory pathway predicted ATPase ExeA
MIRTRNIFILILLIMLFVPHGACFSALSDKQYFDKATTSYIMGNLDVALEELQAALKINPKNMAAQELKKIVLQEKAALTLEAAPVPAPAPAAKPIQEQNPLSARISYFLQHAQEVPIQVYFIASLSTIFSLLLLLLIIKVAGRSPRKEPLICFNCKSKLLPNEEVCPYCGTRAGFKTWHTVSEEQKNWYSKVGWKKNPFTLDIHPELFAGYKNEVKQILEKIRSGSGHILITGPLGIGKTTLLRWLSLSLPDEFLTVYVARPPQEFPQLIKFLMETLGIPVSKSESYYDIYNVEKFRKKVGKKLVIFLDEAHEFSVDIERPLRTLGDLDGVSLVLAGLPETVDKLQSEIKPLYERLVLQVPLKTIPLEDMKELLIARIADAGGKQMQPFTSSALEKIYESSKGIPRVAIKLCDAAVTKAINQNEDKIDASFIDLSFSFGT